MAERILPAMFRKQKDAPVPTGSSLYRRPGADEVPIHARYGQDVADRAAENLNRLRSSDVGPFMGHTGGGGADLPRRRVTTIKETLPPSQDADVLRDRADQRRKLAPEY